MASRLDALHAAGVSIWIDSLSREMLETGELARLVDEDAVTGVTSNPTIFQKALAEGDRYDEQLRGLFSNQLSPSAAQAFLAAVGGGMVTFTGFVFSVVLLMLQFGSSMYSPRAASYFLRDRTTGTTVTFWPDPDIFTSRPAFSFFEMQGRLRNLAALHAGLDVHLRDQRLDPPLVESCCFVNGLADYLD